MSISSNSYSSTNKVEVEEGGFLGSTSTGFVYNYK